MRVKMGNLGKGEQEGILARVFGNKIFRMMVRNVDLQSKVAFSDINIP